jgi:hypothetical protein
MLKTTNGDLKTELGEIADILNMHFHSVLVEENCDQIAVLYPRTGAECDYVVIDETMVLEKLSKLNVHKTPGVDMVNGYVLQKCAAK